MLSPEASNLKPAASRLLHEDLRRRRGGATMDALLEFGANGTHDLASRGRGPGHLSVGAGAMIHFPALRSACSISAVHLLQPGFRVNSGRITKVDGTWGRPYGQGRRFSSNLIKKTSDRGRERGRGRFPLKTSDTSTYCQRGLTMGRTRSSIRLVRGRGPGGNKRRKRPAQRRRDADTFAGVGPGGHRGKWVLKLAARHVRRGHRREEPGSTAGVALNSAWAKTASGCASVRSRGTGWLLQAGRPGDAGRARSGGARWGAQCTRSKQAGGGPAAMDAMQGAYLGRFSGKAGGSSGSPH